MCTASADTGIADADSRQHPGQENNKSLVIPQKEWKGMKS